ncbi:MFS transporter [Aliiruegeria sabulilitoris]|uniref:MFS transporter n=1 Tax=Aliiruegeria sabulilitoris TaxID=1510458 RepID=UPI00082F647C|nr:MFS transporter [Aliiruegeria sabulilitoris]NDR56182.1 MFS transporter [Pseudoruegeria sp. M32A2M]
MRWRMLALLFAARVGLGFSFQTTASASEGISAAFGLGYAEIGMMIGLFTAPGLFLALPVGLSGRFVSDRLLVGLGLAVLAIGGLIAAAAAGPEALTFGRIISGIGALFGMLYFTKMVADLFEGREIATAMSILVMSWPFGIAMGQVGHTWLTTEFGWRVPFAVASAYCAVSALAVLALYQTPNVSVTARPGRTAFLLPREWALILSAGVAWGAFNAGYILYLSFGPEMLKAQGLGVLAAASIISIGSWLMIGSGAVCGQIADRVGQRPRIIAVAMAGAVAALLLLVVPGVGLGASLLFGLVGMAPAGVIIAMSGDAVAAERRAAGMGVFLTVYYAIISLAPPVAGWIFDATGSPMGAILLAASLFALVLPATLLFGWIKSMHPLPHLQEKV